MFVLPTFSLGVVGSPTSPAGFVIEVYDTEAQIFALTEVTDYTIVHAKNTDKLYAWNINEWVVYNQN